MTIEQGRSESLTAHHDRFINLVQVAKSEWAPPLSIKRIASINEDGSQLILTCPTAQANSCSKHLDCVFMAGVNEVKCGECISEPNNLVSLEQSCVLRHHLLKQSY